MDAKIVFDDYTAGANNGLDDITAKIILAGGGGGKQFLIDPYMLDGVTPIMGNKAFPSQYREYSMLPIYVYTDWGYDYNPKLISMDGVYIFQTTSNCNQNIMFFNALKSSEVNKLKFDMWTYSTTFGQWNQCFLNIASSPKVTGIYEGNIDGTIYRSFLTNNWDRTVDQLNNQDYINFVTDNKYQLPRQEFEIDIAGLVRDGIITGDTFYFGIQVCHSAACIRKIEVV